ncbi:MAG: hypothetical protein OXE44_19905 [Nitrospinae bacterium]|nr:hypothetical protein [Nitrospinota bacterium]
MAITLTIDELLPALRMGGSTEERAEVTRLLAYATAAIEQHLGDAYATTPEVVLNEAAIRLCGYLFDKPYANGGVAFANALQNSGAAAILLPYRVHRAGSVSDAEATENTPSVGGLREIGMEVVTITETATWTATTLPVPTSEIAGILTRDPDGNETPINLFRTETLGGSAVIGDPSGQGTGEYSIATDSGGVVVFSSLALGDHVVRLYEVQNAFG